MGEGQAGRTRREENEFAFQHTRLMILGIKLIEFYHAAHAAMVRRANKSTDKRLGRGPLMRICGWLQVVQK